VTVEAKERIFIFGAGGHAKVVIDIVERQGLHEVAFLVDDDPALRGTEFYGYPCIGGKDDLQRLPDAPQNCIVAIGSNRARAAVAGWLAAKGFRLATAVHPAAQIGRGVTIGAGSVVMAGAVINSDARVGENVIINTKASIDHDCVIGDAVHIAPGCTLCGTVTVGAGSFICAGATIIPNLTIGREVTVGAGSTVLRDVGDGILLVGTPARPLKR
jgi:sugar O-acyltransferase (sialic acid O-acetyltransferase NeuD family)